MFSDQLVGHSGSIASAAAIDSIEYHLFSSYLRRVSDNLGNQQASMMLESELLLNRISTQSDQKEMTELCTTEASLYTSRQIDDRSSCNSRDIRTAFKRKSRLLPERKTSSNIAEALQEIKEVCSQRTIATAEILFNDYQRLIEEQSLSDFREGNLKRKREKCETCISKESQLEFRTQQYEEKLIGLNLEIQRLLKKCEDLQKKLVSVKTQNQEGVDRQKAIFQNCRQYLLEKETSLTTKWNEVKLIERQICNNLQKVSEGTGCQRCELVRSIKQQLFEYRRHYEREYDKLEKLFQRYKKIFR